MNIFDQIRCLVTAGTLTEGQGAQYTSLMAGLNGLTTQDLLLFIAARGVSGGSTASNFDPIFADANLTAASGDDIMADTSGGAFTVELPLNPSLGDRVDVYDAQSTFATNNLTIDRNGQLIDSNAGNLIADLNNAHLSIIFTGGDQGWSVFN